MRTKSARIKEIFLESPETYISNKEVIVLLQKEGFLGKNAGSAEIKNAGALISNTRSQLKLKGMLNFEGNGTFIPVPYIPQKITCSEDSIYEDMKKVVEFAKTIGGIQKLQCITEYLCKLKEELE